MRAVLLARLGRAADDGAAPALAERQAGADQPLVGGGHGIAIDPQRLRQLAHRGQRLAGQQAARLRQLAHAVEDLGRAGAGDAHLAWVVIYFVIGQIL